MNKTFTLFLASFSIISVTLLFAGFWNQLNLGPNKVPLAVGATIAFGISIAGLIFGISEIKKSKCTKIIIGLSGHTMIVLIFAYIIYLAMNVKR
jgi:hypothetical protein